jgi:hypothetical protein
VYKLSTVDLVILVLLSFLWAWFGYRLSENDRKNLGRTPWGLPSALWALFWFLSLIVGLVLYLIAHAGGVRRAQQQGVGMPGGMAASMGRAQAPNRAPTVSEQFPAYPRPANVQFDPEPEVVEPAPEPPRAHPGTPVSPPAWHPDPSGRFHWRWWDGSEWTSQVAIDGHHLIDTSPDQRIGPY